MAYQTDTYTTISNRLKEWLTVDNTGTYVTDRALDLINRAQAYLWNYRPWEYFVTTANLTLSSKAASAPADFGRIVTIGWDSDSDGKLDGYFFLNADADNGYKLRDAFVKATGHSYTITFYQTPSYTPVLVYVKVLPDFAGTGTEYSYFPGDLVLRQAQLLHYEDVEMVGNEYQIVKASRDEILRDYEQSHQWVNMDSAMVINDQNGERAELDTFALDGSQEGISDNFDPSYDRR